MLTGAALAAVMASEAGAGRWDPLIAEASRRFDVPAPWIERVIAVESGGRTTSDGRPIRSPKGAIGLMQLMPATWTDMRARLGLGGNPDDPRDNILAGTFYLRLMLDRFGYPGAFAAYNTGPSRYADYLAGTRRLPRESIAYVARIGDRIQPADGQAQPTPRTLFVVVPATGIPIPKGVRDGQSESLFVIRNDQR